MAGVRIRHPELRGTVVLEDVRRPYRSGPHLTPYLCAECRKPDGTPKIHRFKATHLRLDADGTVTVSSEVWQLLEALPQGHGFVRLNVVDRPPPVRLELPRLDNEALLYVPARRTTT